MSEFGKWIKIKPGCEMPNEYEEVLIVLRDRGYNYYVDLGVYIKNHAYIPTPFPELVGFDTYKDWDEGNDIKVIAWMPKPKWSEGE